MKRYLAILALLAVLLAACAQAPQTDAGTPEEALQNFLTHMKRGEYAQADKYVYANEDNDLLSDDLQNFDGGNRAFVDKLQDFSFEIGETDTGEQESTANLKLSHRNMAPVFADVMTELTVLILGDQATQALNDEQIMQKVNEMLAERTTTMEREKSIDTIERDFPVVLRKDKGEWKVDMENEELVMALTGNIFSHAQDAEQDE